MASDTIGEGITKFLAAFSALYPNSSVPIRGLSVGEQCERDAKPAAAATGTDSGASEEAFYGVYGASRRSGAVR